MGRRGWMAAAKPCWRNKTGEWSYDAPRLDLCAPLGIRFTIDFIRASAAEPCPCDARHSTILKLPNLFICFTFRLMQDYCFDVSILFTRNRAIDDLIFSLAQFRASANQKKKFSRYVHSIVDEIWTTGPICSSHYSIIVTPVDRNQGFQNNKETGSREASRRYYDWQFLMSLLRLAYLYRNFFMPHHLEFQVNRIGDGRRR